MWLDPALARSLPAVSAAQNAQITMMAIKPRVWLRLAIGWRCTACCSLILTWQELQPELSAAKPVCSES